MIAEESQYQWVVPNGRVGPSRLPIADAVRIDGQLGSDLLLGEAEI